MNKHNAKTYLVSGGSGSGKSDFAQRLAAQLARDVTYVATGTAQGTEMVSRIRRHRAARPAHWRTLEASRNVAGALAADAGSAPVVLLEDVGSLAATCLPWIDERDKSTGGQVGELARPDAVLDAAQGALEAELEAIFEWCAGHAKALVLVTSDVGSGLLPVSPVGRLYTDVLGRTNQHLAARVDHAFVVIMGYAIDLKALAQQARASLEQMTREA